MSTPIRLIFSNRNGSKLTLPVDWVKFTPVSIDTGIYGLTAVTTALNSSRGWLISNALRQAGQAYESVGVERTLNDLVISEVGSDKEPEDSFDYVSALKAARQYVAATHGVLAAAMGKDNIVSPDLAKIDAAIKHAEGRS